jgi:hypothetical protein
METAKETKKNGKAKAAKQVEKPKATKETGWSIARTMLAAGSKDEAIKKAVHDHLAKTTSPQMAMEYYCQRMSYRALFRAKKAAKAGKGK